MTDIAASVAALLHPLPEPPDPSTPDFTEQTAEAYDAARDAITAERVRVTEQFTLASEDGDVDPLLAALAAARRARDRAESDIRLLIAYGRECVRPRPYTLGDLAKAAGMAASTVKLAYKHDDVERAAALTGAKPREWRASDPTDPVDEQAALEELLADLGRRHQGDPGQPARVYAELKDSGFTPHPPDSRVPGAPPAKRYIRWTRTWPTGIPVTLYQEANHVASSNKIADTDPRHFNADYTGPLTTFEIELDVLIAQVDLADAARATPPA
jgi:hypothetical protein